MFTCAVDGRVSRNGAPTDCGGVHGLNARVRQPLHKGGEYFCWLVKLYAGSRLNAQA
jgi:hypothetical protein